MSVMLSLTAHGILLHESENNILCYYKSLKKRKKGR